MWHRALSCFSWPLALEREALKVAPRHPAYLRFLSSHYEVLARALDEFATYVDNNAGAQ